MKSPNDNPNSPILAIFRLVSAGSHRLPGASGFDKPSMNITATRNRVDRMPMMEA